jgi:hypothetical protein
LNEDSWGGIKVEFFPSLGIGYLFNGNSHRRERRMKRELKTDQDFLNLRIYRIILIVLNFEF